MASTLLNVVSVEELVRRAAGRAPWRELTVGRPDGPEWLALADAERFPADDWYAELLAGVAKGQRDVAGAYLANYLVELVVNATASALIHDGAVWPVRPDTFRVRRHQEEGWFDGMAIAAGPIWQAADPLPDSTDAPDAETFGSEDELFDAVAAGIVEIAAPWFATVRALAPYGRIGMWGMLADGIGSAAMEPVRTDTAAAERAWGRAQHLLDRVAARVPELRARPAVRRIGWLGGEACVATQGTCCLYYKVHDPAGGGERYCLGCPLRPEGESDPLYAAWIEREHGPVSTG